MVASKRNPRFSAALKKSAPRFLVPAAAGLGIDFYFKYFAHSNPLFVRSLGIYLLGSITGAFIGDAVQFYQEDFPKKLDRAYRLSDMHHSRSGLITGVIVGSTIGLGAAMIPVVQMIAEQIKINQIESPLSPQRPVQAASNAPAQFNR